MTLKPLSTKPRKQTSAGGNKLPESPPVNLDPPIRVKREKSAEIAFPNLMVGDAWAKLQCKPYDEAEKKVQKTMLFSKLMFILVPFSSQ